MQNEIYQQEPNLIAEAYRNKATSQIPRRIERHFDFIDINNDGLLLLGTSNLGGRIWSGSVWIFDDYPTTPDAENCVAGIEFESSVASGLWLNEKNIIIGCDSGSLHHLSLTDLKNKNSNYFTTEGISTEHDDSIVTLDLMSQKMKILSGGMDMNIKIWDAQTLVTEKSFSPAHGHIVTSVSTIVDNCDTFASTSLDGNSLIWDLREKKPASLLISNDCGFTSSVWLDENSIALGSNDGSVSLIDLRTKSEIDNYPISDRPIFKLNYNKQLQCLAVCADDPFVRVFNCTEMKLINLYESDEHKDFVRGLSWEPSTNILHSCGWDSKIFSHRISPSQVEDKKNLESYVKD